MNIKKSIKRALTNKDIRQKELANELGVTTQLISRWSSTGKISQDNLIKVSEFFEMTVGEFIALGESEV